MRDRLIEIVDKSKEEYANDVTDHTETEYIVEGLLNKGAILPPCKVGDTVYWLNFYNHLMLYRDKYYEAEVIRIVVTRFGVSCVIRVRGEHATYDIPDVEFGKNVFLTREEAEQALKGEQTWINENRDRNSHSVTST